jgi:hypothetical protein
MNNIGSAKSIRARSVVFYRRYRDGAGDKAVEKVVENHSIEIVGIENCADDEPGKDTVLEFRKELGRVQIDEAVEKIWRVMQEEKQFGRIFIWRGESILEESKPSWCFDFLEAEAISLLCCERVAERLGAACVITDSMLVEWWFSNKAIKVLRLRHRDPCVGERTRRKIWAFLRYGYYSAGSAAWFIILPWLLNALNRIRGHREPNIAKGISLLVGDEHSFRRVLRWGNREASIGDLPWIRDGGPRLRNWGSRDSRVLCESYSCIKLRGLVGRVFGYFRMAIGAWSTIYSFTEPREHLNNAAIQELFEDKENETARYICRNLAHVVGLSEVGCWISHSNAVQEVCLGQVHTWPYMVLNKLLQRNGIRTVSQTHGMVCNVNAYDYPVNIMFADSEFDRLVLERYTSKPKKLFFVCHNDVDRIIKLPREYGEIRRVLLLPSSWSETCRIRFYRCSLTHLGKVMVGGKRSICIKLHPNESAKSVMRVIKELHLERIDLRRKREKLQPLMEEADIVLCMLSSTIVDCINMGKRFFWFNDVVYPKEHFGSALPRDLQYRTAEELEGCWKKKLDWEELFQEMRARYYDVRNGRKVVEDDAFRWELGEQSQTELGKGEV